MEDQEQRFIFLALDFLLRVRLMPPEQLRLQLDITGLIHTVDVSERGRDGEVWGYGGEGGVDLIDILGLGVQRAVVDVCVVDTVFLTTGNADFLYIFHQPDAPRHVSRGKGHTISSHCFIGAAL